MSVRIELLPASQDIARDVALGVAASGQVFACDFYIPGIEGAEPRPWGFADGRLENIDHHAPVPRMARHVSSAHLALDRLTQLGPAGPGDTVVINHTDCDSVLSASMMAGLLPADQRFADAALAADHTGADDPIADILQGLDRRRDFALSLRNLIRWLSGEALEPVAQAGVAERRRLRDEVGGAAAAGKFERVGPVALGVFDQELYGEFLPAALPDAAVIVTAMHHPARPERWVMKVRLGAAAASGLTLHALRVRELDPAYGGRWNAGSNKRGGGTVLDPAAYAAALAERVVAAETVVRRDRATGG